MPVCVGELENVVPVHALVPEDLTPASSPDPSDPLDTDPTEGLPVEKKLKIKGLGCVLGAAPASPEFDTGGVATGASLGWNAESKSLPPINPENDSGKRIGATTGVTGRLSPPRFRPPVTEPVFVRRCSHLPSIKFGHLIVSFGEFVCTAQQVMSLFPM